MCSFFLRCASHIIMRNEMLGRFQKRHGVKGNWIIVALTGFVLVLVVLLTFRLHYANKKEVLSQFKDHQFLHAQNIAKQIESLLTGHSTSLQTLSSFSLSTLMTQNRRRPRFRSTTNSWKRFMSKRFPSAMNSGKGSTLSIAASLV